MATEDTRSARLRVASRQGDPSLFREKLLIFPCIVESAASRMQIDVNAVNDPPTTGKSVRAASQSRSGSPRSQSWLSLAMPPKK